MRNATQETIEIHGNATQTLALLRSLGNAEGSFPYPCRPGPQGTRPPSFVLLGMFVLDSLYAWACLGIDEMGQQSGRARGDATAGDGGADAGGD